MDRASGRGAKLAYESGSAEPVVTGTFTLHCRGEVRLYLGPTDCTPKSKKGRALLAILAAEQRPLTRVKIIDLLWSDRQEEQARGSLRTLLADLKEQLNSDFDELLVVERERVALGPNVRTDLTDPSLARPAGELFEGLDHVDPELDEWLRVAREQWRARAPLTSAPVAAGTPHRSRNSRFHLAIAAVLLVAVAATALLYLRPWGAPHQPVIAVLKFRDLTGANALVADGIAEQLRIELAQNPKLQIIAKESSEAPPLTGADIAAKRRMLGATHLLEGTVLGHDGQTQLSLRLVDAENGRAIWSAQVPATGPAVIAGRDAVVDQIAETVGELAHRRQTDHAMAADTKAYNDLFRARAMLGYDEPQLLQARSILFETVSRYPDFAPALVALAEANLRLSDHPISGVGSIPVEEANREADRYARRAAKVAPDYGPAYALLANLTPDLKKSGELIRRQVELNPGSSGAQANWATALMFSGKPTSEVIQHLQIAARLDPLNQFIQEELWDLEMAAGKREETRSSIREFLARDIPEAKRQEVIAVTETTLFGDLSNGYVAAVRAGKLKPGNLVSNLPLMWNTLHMYGRSAALTLARPNSLTSMLLRDDLAGVAKRVEQMGTRIWELNYESFAAGDYLLHHGRGALLVKAFDQGLKNGIPRDKLINPISIGALQQVGRSEEARQMTEYGVRYLTSRADLAATRKANRLAILLSYKGDKDAAIKQLAIAHRNTWWGLSDILDHPYNHYAFRSLRSDPRFKALVRDYDAFVARERRETIAQLAKAGLPPPPSSPPPAAILT